MSNYDFSTLNDKEFEQISKDLLNAKLKLSLENFKAGKDKGIDLRYSTPLNNNAIVVQVTHYQGSGFAQLKNTLISKELEKIKKLKPERYIIVTSLPLSATQKDVLKDLLSPFILSSNDVFGQEDLNSILSEFTEIEKKYFKLWFSSISILEAVLNNAVEGRSRYLLENIKNKIPFYVITRKLDDANKILQKEKLLLITGQPGIGKTTLAEIILFDRAKNGFKIHKVENITEAETVISTNPEVKQIFYFDDFLGANYVEILNSKNTETQLTSFVERVKNSPNKYLILTTRTVILNHAVEKYEKIYQSRIATNQFEIKLNDYNKIEKAQILYNHLYFNNVNEDLLEAILYEKFYNKIIEHSNYTPRIIEFITEKYRLEKFSPEAYIQFILNNLNNPKEIWRYSFTNQIEYLDKCLLLTLFSLNGSSTESVLMITFERRLAYEKKEHNQIIQANQFFDSIKILLNGFISSKLLNTIPPSREYSFINPSLADFLIGYVSESFPEQKSIISSLKYAEQLKRFNPDEKIIPLGKELQLIIREKILKSELEILKSSENQKHALYIEILCKYCSAINTDNLLLQHLIQINFSQNWHNILSKIEYFLLNLGDAPQTFEYIKENFIKIIETMMESIFYYRSASYIPKIFQKYEQNYVEYSTSEEGKRRLIDMMEVVIDTSESDIHSTYEDSVTDIDQIIDSYNEVEILEDDLKSELFPVSTIDYDFNVEMDINYWEEKVKEVAKKLDYEATAFEDYDQDYYKEMRHETRNENAIIDDLFNKPE